MVLSGIRQLAVRTKHGGNASDFSHSPKSSFTATKPKMYKQFYYLILTFLPIHTKYITRKVTVEIRFQGGIVAARALSSIFMVQQVEAVPHVGKVIRDRYKSVYSDARKENSTGTFAQLLEDAVEENRSASMGCHITTYGRDSRIRIFDYQPGNRYN